MKKFMFTVAVMTMAVCFNGCANKESSESDTTAEALVTTESTEITTEATTEEVAIGKATTEQIRHQLSRQLKHLHHRLQKLRCISTHGLQRLW